MSSISLILLFIPSDGIFFVFFCCCSIFGNVTYGGMSIVIMSIISMPAITNITTLLYILFKNSDANRRKYNSDMLSTGLFVIIKFVSAIFFCLCAFVRSSVQF